MQTEFRKAPWPALWEAPRVHDAIFGGAIGRNLNAAARNELEALTDTRAKVKDALKHPKPLNICMPMFNAVLAAQYYELFAALHLPATMTIYEPCVGASNPVLLAAEALSAGAASYLTINLNRKLCAQLREKIAHFKMPVRIIEENAQKALALLQAQSFDVACFHHAINDILQTAVSEPRGLDTTQIDWFPNERQMIEWLAEDAKAGQLSMRGKPELMQIIGDAINLVRPGGYLIFDHFNWCRFIGVEWFPWELFYNFISMTREWLTESAMPVSEIRFEGVDPQWWMILQVRNVTK